MNSFVTWWKDLVNRMNEKGIPVPMARANGKPSITATMVMVSFAMCVVPVLLMIGTVLTKLAGVFTLNDANQTQLMNAFSSAIQLYIASLGAYLGRGMQRGADGKVVMEKAEESEGK
jgi:H+/gluconate symporter-like permease